MFPASALLDVLSFERAVDAAWVAAEAGEAAQSGEFATSLEANAARRGRSVDAAARFCRLNRRLRDW